MPGRYSISQRVLHWVVAILVIGAIAAGLMIDAYDGFKGLKDAFGISTTNLIYKFHKTAGVLILGFMVVRLLVRLTHGKPSYVMPLPAMMALASTASHTVLYLALFAMPITGWLATAAGGFPVEFFNMKLPGLIGKDKALSEQLYELHDMIGTVILVVGTIHIAAAIWHWRIRRDGIMGRMTF